MVIVINQKNPKENYVSWMLDFINEFGNYLGVIAYANPGDYVKSPQPMFIWKKDEKKDEIKQNGILKTKRLHLAKFTKADEKDFIAMQSKKENMETLGSGRVKTADESRKQLSNYLSEYKNETYARFYKIMLGNEFIGYIGYYDGSSFRHPALYHNMLRILIDSDYRKKGYASEIAHPFLEKFVYKHIHMMVEVFNDPSNKLFSRYIRKQINYKDAQYYVYDIQQKKYTKSLMAK